MTPMSTCAAKGSRSLHIEAQQREKVVYMDEVTTSLLSRCLSSQIPLSSIQLFAAQRRASMNNYI